MNGIRFRDSTRHRIEITALTPVHKTVTQDGKIARFTERGMTAQPEKSFFGRRPDLKLARLSKPTAHECVFLFLRAM